MFEHHFDVRTSKMFEHFREKFEHLRNMFEHQNVVKGGAVVKLHLMFEHQVYAIFDKKSPKETRFSQNTQERRKFNMPH